MKILILGGTRFFGIYTVEDLLEKGHDVTIATRGKAHDGYGGLRLKGLRKKASKALSKGSILML